MKLDRPLRSNFIISRFARTSSSAASLELDHRLLRPNRARGRIAACRYGAVFLATAGQQESVI
jgi:hypothetical protein